MRRRGFTLVELLVVIAIIGVLVALLLPAVQAAREAARRSACLNNMKQIALALHNYESTNERLPNGSSYTSAAGPHTTWAAEVLPFMELQTVFDRFDFTRKMSDRRSVNEQAAAETAIPVYTCPSDERANEPILLEGRGESSLVAGGGSNNPAQAQGLWYTGSIGPTSPDGCDSFCPEGRPSYCCRGCSFGTWPVSGENETCDFSRGPGDSSVGMFSRFPIGYEFAEVTDGLSNTLMIGETLPYHCIWNCVFCPNFPLSSTSVPMNHMESDSGTRDGTWRRVCGFKSSHPGGAQFAMGDASVRFLTETMDYRLFNELGTRADQEPVDLP